MKENRELSQDEIDAIYNNFMDTHKYKETVIDDPDGDKENATLKIDTEDGKSYEVLTSAVGDEKWWEWGSGPKSSEDDGWDDEMYDDDLDPEGGVVDEVELEDLDFETLKAAFPKFYQNVKFTRIQPNGEEGPYYEDAISFPNLDDSSMVIGDASSLEDWKNKVSRRFGNVEIVFNDEAKNSFDRVFVSDDAFNDARDGFIKGKMSAMQRDEEKEFMTEMLQIRAGIIK